jgi:hypothetical protein
MTALKTSPSFLLTFLLALSSSSLLFDGVMSQVINTNTTLTDFPCGDPNDAELIVSDAIITSVRVGAFCDGNECDFLTPKNVHWHIYALPPGSTPKQSITPAGFIRPVLTNNGELHYEFTKDLEESYAAGDRLEAGVQLYLPVDTLKSIRVTGVDQFVDVSINQSFLAQEKSKNMSSSADILQIIDDGVDNIVTVTSPYVPVDFVGSGVDSLLVMDAAAGSTLFLSGVDFEAYIKSQGLEIYADGVDTKIVVEGNVSKAVMKGVDGDLEINGGGCNNVALQGVDNKCEYTNETVTVNSLSCTVETEASYNCWFNHISTGAAIGLGLGLLVILFVSVGGIVYCCCRKRCANQPISRDIGKNEQSVPRHQMKETTLSNEEATHTSVVEAEVLEIQNHHQPANTNVDIESADATSRDGAYLQKYSS